MSQSAQKNETESRKPSGVWVILSILGTILLISKTIKFGINGDYWWAAGVGTLAVLALLGSVLNIADHFGKRADAES